MLSSLCFTQTLMKLKPNASLSVSKMMSSSARRTVVRPSKHIFGQRLCSDVSFVVWAIREGSDAAIAMHKYLQKLEREAILETAE